MIAMMRVDDRLIHGQVAVMWSKNLQVDRILVANDQIAEQQSVKSVNLEYLTPKKSCQKSLFSKRIDDCKSTLTGIATRR